MAQFYKPKKKAKHSGGSPIESILIDGLSDDGRGLARIPNTQTSVGKTVFIEGALSQEVVNARVVNSANRFSEAYATEILKASSSRVEPVCSHYALCGGCDLQHMEEKEQHRFKLQAALDQLKKWSQIEPDHILPTLTGGAYRYRRRVRLGVSHRQPAKGKLTLGFRRKNSQQLVRITECAVMTPSLEALIKPLDDWLERYKPAVSHVELIDSGQSIGVVVRYNRSLPPESRQQLHSSLKSSLPSLDIACWFQGKKQANLEDAFGESINPKLYYCLNDPKSKAALRLAFHPQDFIQSNALVNQLMINQAIDLMKPRQDESILDLFCGVGNFSLPFSRLSKQLVGVEGLESMALVATHNAKENGCDNTQFLSLDLFDRSQLNSSTLRTSRFDGLILDPPRAGAKIVCENMNKLMPKRIVYVSCDSSTFARDAKALEGHGYKLSHLGMLDMFPQTAHSEVMGLFVHPLWQQQAT